MASGIIHLCKYCLDSRGLDPDSQIVPMFIRMLCEECGENTAKYEVTLDDED